jgi:predicted  nucleic acid-binding Zn-ribbon protein
VRLKPLFGRAFGATPRKAEAGGDRVNDMNAVEELREELERATAELEAARRENERLRAQVAALERRIALSGLLSV